MKSYPGCTRAALSLLMLAVTTGARAQTNDERGGFAVREVSLSSGYASVHLPPITLGGFLPLDVLSADLITDAAAAIEWRRNTPRTKYAFDMFGVYTARARYAQLNSPGADLRLGVSHQAGNRWHVRTGLANEIASSDQLAVHPTQARRLIDDAASFDDLAGTMAFARSPNPDPAQGALFVPIRQSLAGADLYGDRIMASSANASATYTHSARLATYFRGSYASARRISSHSDPDRVLAFPDTTAGGAGVGIRYDRSERTQLTAALDWSQTSGVTADKLVLATLGYAWSGRKWFATTTAGVGVRPFKTPVTDLPLASTPSQTPTLILNLALGYKFRTQTLLVHYSHAPHDEYGYGGRNVETGFEGNVQSVAGSWLWAPPRGRWLARSDFSMVRRPGNFSYIYAWLATAGIGRQLGPNVRLIGEVFFDRHGSRGFEGFHLTREGARLNLVWNPSRRPVQ